MHIVSLDQSDGFGALGRFRAEIDLVIEVLFDTGDAEKSSKCYPLRTCIAVNVSAKISLGIENWTDDE